MSDRFRGYLNLLKKLNFSAVSRSEQRFNCTKLHFSSFITISSFCSLAVFSILIGSYIQRAIASHGCSDAVAITANTSWNTNQCHGDVTVTNGAILTIAGGVTADLSNLTLGDGVTNGFITAQGNTGSGLGVTINVDGTVEVKSGSSVSANGQGFTGGAGTGAGTSGGGGGYGGEGGKSTGGTTYGSVTAPTNLGSGGATSGGAGGGAIKFSIGGNLINDGSITSNGNGGAANGGGSGGSIWIDFTGGSSTWTGGGTITATGGGANASQGGGGGGRISVTGYTSATHGSPTATGGVSSQFFHGQAGTVFTKTAAQTNGKLFIYNNGLDYTVGKYTHIGTAALTVDILSISWNGYLRIRSGDSLTVASAGSYDGGTGGIGTLQNEGTFVFPNSVTLPATHTTIQRGTMNSSSTDLVISNTATLTADSAATFHDITVQSGGKITHTANTTTETFKTDITANNVTVDSGGLIDMNGVGYATSEGPGQNVSAGGGGSHGGMGNSTAPGGQTYGSTSAPVNIGSGGSGAPGGGAVKLTLSGNLTNNGTIRANGNNAAGAGSGGSVYILFNGGSSTWSGSGGMTANGGTTGTNAGGGGGRVAVVNYVTDTHAGTVSAFGGTGASGSHSAAGTVYTKSSAASNGSLVINNNNVTPSSGKYTRIGDTSLTVASFTLQNGVEFHVKSGETFNVTTTYTTGGTINDFLNEGTLTLPSSTFTLSYPFEQKGTFNSSGTSLTVANGTTYTNDGTTTISTLTIQSGGILTHSSNTTSETNKLFITAVNLTVDSGGLIDGLAKGYTAENGPGGAPAGGTSGGTYGGTGVSTILPYGSTVAPVNIGSGGNGGAGGGAFRFALSGNFTNNGTIRSTANNTGGSGSGGSIYVAMSGGSSTWSGNGTITANGGNSTASGGGGGGRVAITGYVTNTYSGTTTAQGGTGGGSNQFTSAPGTVFTKSASQTNGTLLIENRNIAPNSPKYTGTNETNLTVDVLNVQNASVFRIASGQTLTVANGGSNTLSSNSTLDNDGTLATGGSVTTSISGAFISDGSSSLGAATVLSGGNITHTANTTSETFKATISATSLAINSGGTINVNSVGYQGGTSGAGSGPGAGGGGGSSSSGGGAGYGGAGGAGAGAAAGSAGGTYGTASNPTNIGSGGGKGNSAGANGGAGGGAVLLTVSGLVDVSGSITANGANGTTGSFGGGAGSGGTVKITAGSLSGNGPISANGGNGAGTTQVGGCGGGGRIAFSVSGSNTYSGTVTASVGTGSCSGGGAGSQYSPPTAPTNFAVDSKTVTSITWEWLDASTTETSFRLQDNSHNEIASVSSTTTAGTGAEYTYQENSLSVNTSYSRHVHAHDGINESTASSTVSAYTLANTPGTPTLSSITTSAITVTINQNSNPASTEFTIFESTTGNYVQANGTLGSTTVWQTYTNWGGGSGKQVTGLSVNTAYSFQVKARNGDNVETALSSAASNSTLANVPGAPTLSNVTSTTLKITLAVNSNPASTEFAIFESTTSKYVQSNGSLGISAVWQTNSSWGGASGKVVNGLTPTTGYTFAAKARNGDSVETALSSTASTTTDVAPAAPTVNAPTTVNAVAITWSWNDTSTNETEFHLHDASHNVIATVSSTTTGTTGTVYTYNETSLSANTEYIRHVHASDGADGAASSDITQYTLAIAPNAPSPSGIGVTSVTIVIDTTGNPANTEYAIFESNNSTYVSSSGTLASNPPPKKLAFSWVQTAYAQTTSDWQTFSEWGGSNGMTVSGLDPASDYAFAVKARNGSNTETILSSDTDIQTNAAIPASPEVIGIGDTSVRIRINRNGNPDSVTYSIVEEKTDKYVLANGTLGSERIWQSYGAWGGDEGVVVTGLSPNQEYFFRVFARTSGGVITEPCPVVIVKTRVIQGTPTPRPVGVPHESEEDDNTVGGPGPTQTPHEAFPTPEPTPRPIGSPYIGKIREIIINLPGEIAKTFCQLARLMGTPCPKYEKVKKISWPRVYREQPDSGGAPPQEEEAGGSGGGNEPEPTPTIGFGEGEINDPSYVVKCHSKIVVELKENEYIDDEFRRHPCVYVIDYLQGGNLIGSLTNPTVIEVSRDEVADALREQARVAGFSAVIGDVTPGALAVGGIAGAISLISNGSTFAALISNFASNVSSFASQLPINFLFFRRRRKGGRVRIALGNQGLSGAFVALVSGEDYNRVVNRAVTDRDGRFGFLVPAGVYRIKVSHPNYLFPSQLDQNGNHGEDFVVKEAGTIDLDIPMDPKAKKQTVWTRIESIFLHLRVLRRPLLIMGSIITVLYLIQSFTIVNILFFIYYTYLWIEEIKHFRASDHVLHVKDRKNRPIPFAIVRLKNPDHTAVFSKATDALGRVFPSAPKGEYELEVVVPSQSGAKAKIINQPIRLAKGILDHKLIITVQ